MRASTRRQHGSMLFNAAMGLLVIFGLIASVMTLVQQTRASSLLRNRVNQVVLITNEIRHLDADGSLEMSQLHRRIREGHVGMLHEQIVEQGAIYSALTESAGAGIPAKRVYFNFTDSSGNICRKMQEGLVDNGSGLFGGNSALLGQPAMVRCRDLEGGRTQSEIRVPYRHVDAFMKSKGF